MLDFTPISDAIYNLSDVVDNVDSILRELKLEGSELDCFVLVGSVAEGYGTPTSDLDFVAIMKDGGRGGGVSPVAAGWHQGRRLVCNITTFEALGAMMTEVLTCTQDAFNALHYKNWERTHRLFRAKPLLGASALAQFMSNYSYSDFQELLVQKYARDAIENFSDLLGSSAANDGATMTVNARLLLEASVDAVCARHQSTNPKAKWRLRRLDELWSSGALPPMPDLPSALFPRMTDDLESSQAQVERMLTVARRLQRFYLLGAPTSPSGPSVSVLGSHGGARYGPVSWLFLATEGDRLLILGPRKIHKVTELLAAVWLSVDQPMSAAEVADAVSRLAPTQIGWEDRIDWSLEHLAESGLLARMASDVVTRGAPIYAPGQGVDNLSQ